MLNVFGGHGFVGSNYVKRYPTRFVNSKDDYQAEPGIDILYFISTVDNYNVFTDLHIDIDTNLNVLMSVLESIADPTTVTFNFVSSWFVYGNSNVPAKETDPCHPRGFYSITKHTAEQLLISYCETMGMKYRILRLANVLGPTDDKVSKKKNALQYIIGQLKSNEKVELYNGGNFIRDYMYIDDCVDAIDLITRTGEVNTIYNVGNGVPLRFVKLVEMARDMMGSTSIITSIEPPPFHKVVQVESMYLDTTKLQSLGYRSTYSVEGMVQQII